MTQRFVSIEKMKNLLFQECFYIAEAGDATREIKRQVVAVLDAMGIKKD